MLVPWAVRCSVWLVAGTGWPGRFGVGTFLVALGIGPAVDMMTAKTPWLQCDQASLRGRRRVNVSNGVSAPSGPPTS